MASFNKVILIGNMVADPELKQTQGGISVSSFNIAVNRRFSKDGEQACDFIGIVAWRQQAEFVARYFKKGMPILICGQLQTRTWTDNGGQKRYATEVIADEVCFVAPAQNASEAKQGGYTPSVYGGTNAPQFEEFPPNAGEDGLPF